MDRALESNACWFSWRRSLFLPIIISSFLEISFMMSPHRVGRTARLDEKGEALLFLQPVEIDYLHDLKLHGVSLSEYPLQRIFFNGQQQHNQKLIYLDTNPSLLLLQKGLESFISSQAIEMNSA
ncbi:DEAD-box ATP-dependent RNA helicase 17 [Platanthera zijinensis]|uniref:DEAD-box ATP-dependent RNA helicase 17 n=1 Tax=Platanthera zijinensis TaxID=2320716 RepID=A0AAP0B676_9ASPA